VRFVPYIARTEHFSAETNKMLITYKLKKGETFSTVMKKNGVTDWKTSWDLPENKALKTKRRTADKVEAGDTLTFVDAKARVFEVTIGGKDFVLTEGDFEELQAEVFATLRKKYLPRLSNLKAAYDADHDFMASLVTDSGMLIGTLAVILEDLSGAKLPTREMNAVSDAIKAVQSAMKKEDLAASIAALRSAESAMADYVAAAETYRKKMNTAADVGVQVAYLTQEASFTLLSALLSAYLTRLTAGAISARKISMISGALTGALKAASNEVGEAASGNERSWSEIGYNVAKEAIFGAAGGLASNLLRGTAVGRKVAEKLAVKLQEKSVSYAIKGAKAGKFGKWKLSGTLEKLPYDKVADEVSGVIMRVNVGIVIKVVLAELEAKDHADRCVRIVSDAIGSLTGKESLTKAADAIADAFAECEEFMEAAFGRLVEQFQKAIEKLLDAELDRDAA
jgi:hypothetical protein